MSLPPPSVAPVGTPAPPGSQAANIRHDPQPLDAGWPMPWQPTRWERMGRLARTGCIALPTALLVAGVWAGHGLREDTTNARRVQAGTVQHIGPLDIAINDAVAQHTVGAKTWSLVVRGSCRNASDAPIPSVYELVNASMMVADGRGQHLSDDHILDYYGVLSLSPTARRDLTPSDVAQPCVFKTEMPDGYQPQSTARVALQQVAWFDAGVLQEGDVSWHPARGVVVMVVPLRVIPE